MLVAFRNRWALISKVYYLGFIFALLYSAAAIAITISIYLSMNGEYFKLLFEDSNKSYLSITNNRGETVNYGEIFANVNMDELIIVKGDNAFVFPANNLEVAEKIANKYFSIEYNNHFKN